MQDAPTAAWSSASARGEAENGVLTVMTDAMREMWAYGPGEQRVVTASRREKGKLLDGD